ncbi:MAG: VOC family protein [Candidatus Diapherotrites archaeon]|nr:VOC family protein [Candidatus Diapherotrites archaeon]
MDKVVHFEIPADNIERAKKFYSNVFGWDIQQVPDPTMEYHMVYTVKTDEKTRMPVETGGINGGMSKRMAQGETPVIVVNVKSLDESLQKAQREGAKIVMPKTTVMDMGLYARIQDPEGNVVGVWQDLPKNH